MKPLPQSLALGLALLSAWFAARSDTLKLEDGTVLRGRYAGGTPGLLRFETRDGMENVLRARARVLTFSDDEDRLPEADSPREDGRRPGGRGNGERPAGPMSGGRGPLRGGAEAPPARVSSPGPGADLPAAQRDPAVTVPAGAVLTVTLAEGVPARGGAGRKVTGRLAGNLFVEGKLAAAAGTRVLLEIADSARAGRLAGKSRVELVLTQMDFAGTLVPVRTEAHKEEGTGSLHKTARNAALGALIGEATGDNAASGAAIGAGTGLARDGESLDLPAGTTLDFELIQPFTTP